MGISWLTVLKAVPWSDVISHAPKVAEGARSLWGAVSKKRSSEADPQEPASQVVAAEGEMQSVAALQGRVAALAADVANLQAQMLKSSELIKELAEQNTQLISRVEANRQRAQRLAFALGVVAAIAIAGLVVAQRA